MALMAENQSKFSHYLHLWPTNLSTLFFYVIVVDVTMILRNSIWFRVVPKLPKHHSVITNMAKKIASNTYGKSNVSSTGI